uniref:Relaxin n=1 Tax=Leucoraja erinaceus TaxID=7782 RepID=RELX_LEUER|nr:RecName: Full=Relaxin; Contains: RecName: Full=Relaxin B chain; Contains: RecName: Full=Relaxin A chain [Leucoraja erinacea]
RPNWEERSRLCGRDLIRAFIYLCGGTRWTRLPNFGNYPIMEEKMGFAKKCCAIGCSTEDFRMVC